MAGFLPHGGPRKATANDVGNYVLYEKATVLSWHWPQWTQKGAQKGHFQPRIKLFAGRSVFTSVFTHFQASAFLGAALVPPPRVSG